MRALPQAVLLLSVGSGAVLGAGDGGGSAASLGERLLSEASCAACHAPPAALEERIAPRPAPDLGAVGARYEPRALRRFLLQPHTAKPGTAMPDMLTGLGEEERGRAAEELLHLLVSFGGPLPAEPVRVAADELEHGRRLYHSVGCVACHAPQESADALLGPLWDAPEAFWDAPEGSVADAFEDDLLAAPPHPLPSVALPPGEVPLGDLAARTSVPALAGFLADPLAVRPGGSMPSMGLSEAEARAIASYLLRGQAARGLDSPHREQGLAYEYHEARMDGKVADFSRLQPVRRGSTDRLDRLPAHREDHFGFRFHGRIDVPERGTWRFSTTSDDGSRLWIEGRLVVRNDGFHSMTRASGEVWLEAGLHAVAIDYFEHDGQQGLVVEWEGPGVPRQVIPPDRLSHASIELAPPHPQAFEIDSQLAQAGRARFRELGCGACHPAGDELDLAPSAPPGELEALDAKSAAGCLGPEPRAGLPRYALGPAEREALEAALGDLAALEAPLSPAEQVARAFERFACLQCHEREGLGGVHPERRDYFQPIDESQDLGDQARYPPPLDQVGRKLRRERLRAVLEEGAGARPYLAARMPRFGATNVGHLVDAFGGLDLRAGDDREPGLDAERIALGRRLVGTSGLGCIQCHAFAGYEGLGTPAVDLADTFAHLRPAWFHELLRDPSALGQSSRMPDFWLGGKSPVLDVYEGDPERQIEALRAYLSLGHEAPLPEGLALPEDAYELLVGTEPVLCGVFLSGVSPRTMVVGTPEALHYAFDMQHSRLAKLWRGRFFDARGTWHARAGVLQEPPVEDVHDLPTGMALARLEAADAPWPTGIGGDAGFFRLGHRFDAERYPVWRYRFGELLVEEHPRPRTRASELLLVRSFRIECRAAEPPRDLYLEDAGGRRLVEFELAPFEDAQLTGLARWIAHVVTEVSW